MSSRGGLLVAPSSACPQGYASPFLARSHSPVGSLALRPAVTPLRSFVSRCSFALCRERTHQGDGKPSPQEKTRMHTRNVNVKTAAQESS
ncbi:hypothetical protein ACV8SA_27190, partial [Citrobacter freundii]